LVDPVGYLRARLAALVGALVGRVDRVRERVPRVAQDASVPGGRASPSDDGPTMPGERVEAAWARFVDRVSPPSPRTTTPGQVARRAVDAGLPRGPVDRLTDAFRAVEYADADPERHVDAAESAAAELAGDEDRTGDADATPREDEP
jgi:hypothetical protein